MFAIVVKMVASTRISGAVSPASKQCCQTYGISENTDFFPFLYRFFIFFHSIFTIFLGNFLWFLRTSQFYSGAKGVVRVSVSSMITKCESDHRSDHNVLELEHWKTQVLTYAIFCSGVDVNKYQMTRYLQLFWTFHIATFYIAVRFKLF